MKIKRHLIDATIIHNGIKVKVEETEEFYKIAKNLGLDVFAPIRKEKKKTKVEPKKEDVRDNQGE